MQSDGSFDHGPHVAIILDGNGRWAMRRGLPRPAGHRAGVRAVRRIVEEAGRQGVAALTLFAFSSDNWQRPRLEVEALMALFERYLSTEVDRACRHGLRLNVIGRRDRLPRALVDAIEDAEKATAAGSHMLLRIAVDYSARQMLAQAARALSLDEPELEGCEADAERLNEALEVCMHSVSAVPPVDLLIRTSGEQRLSDFLLWESAYAELYFSSALWPDFGPTHLVDALAEFAGRERRFGCLPMTGSAPTCRSI